MNDGDDSTGEIQCADTPYSGYYFAPVPGRGTVPKWEDLGEDDDPSLPVSQITLRTDASGEFQFIYGYLESYANTEPSVEVKGDIVAGRMIITSITDKTNGRNTEPPSRDKTELSSNLHGICACCMLRTTLRLKQVLKASRYYSDL